MKINFKTNFHGRLFTALLFSLITGISVAMQNGSRQIIKSSDKLDPNFYIYICFGQSNMEGNASIGDADRIGINPRFKMMAVCNGVYSGQQRYAGNWYTAIPPLCRQDTGLTPADYFGRVLTDSLPDSIKVGIIMVAIGGASIDAFDKDNYKTYYDSSVDWLKSIMNQYGGNPYAKIIEMAKNAQKVGVIKGILLHQGETNNGQTDWPDKVKKICDDMTTDLGLSPDSIPLLAGEMRYKDQGGICWGMNSIIDDLPHTINNCYVVSADSCQGNTVDGFHFSTEGARELGRRYGLKMYSLIKKYNTIEGRTVDHLTLDTIKFSLLTGSYLELPLKAVYQDGHIIQVNKKATYQFNDSTLSRVYNGYLEVLKDGNSEIKASYIDEEGKTSTISFNVESSSFPLTTNYFNPSIYGNGSFDAKTHSVTTDTYGFGGWQYSNGLDLSDYKYLIVQLASPQSCGASFRIFDENSYWASSCDNPFGNSIKMIVNLNSMKKTANGVSSACSPSHIYIMGFWSYGGSPIKIKDIFLSNDGINPVTTDIHDIMMGKADVSSDIFTIDGIKINRLSNNLKMLPRGLYIKDRKSIFVK
jgi:hypothetical protein